MLYKIHKKFYLLVPDRLKEQKDVLKKFVVNPLWLLESKENIRLLADALFYLTGESGAMRNANSHQYHIAAFFDEDGFKTSTSGSNWGRLTDGLDSPSGFLGVFVMFSDRKFVEQLIRLAQRAGKMSFAVIDNGNILRYPVKAKLT